MTSRLVVRATRTRGRIQRDAAARTAPRPPARFDPALADLVSKALSPRAEVRRGTMFGYPAFYTRGRLFACVFRDDLGLKLPADVVEALVTQRGFRPFRRMGRVMREWVTGDRDGARRWRRDPSLLLRSLEFVGSISSRPKGR